RPAHQDSPERAFTSGYESARAQVLGPSEGRRCRFFAHRERGRRACTPPASCVILVKSIGLSAISVAHSPPMYWFRPKNRILPVRCMVVTYGALAACRGTDTTPTGPSRPPPIGSTIVYSAVGASDVIGYGSSKPCLPYEDCNGGGYV